METCGSSTRTQLTDGNLWFSDRGAKAIGKISLQLPPKATTGKIGNQQLTLTTPSTNSCTSKSTPLSVTLRSSTIKNSHAARLRFVSASFFLDKGVRHTRKKTVHFNNGRTKRLTVGFFKPNSTVHQVPSTVRLRLAGLNSGSHTLKVTVSFHQAVSKHGHRRTVTVSNTLTERFRVC